MEQQIPEVPQFEGYHHYVLEQLITHHGGSVWVVRELHRPNELVVPSAYTIECRTSGGGDETGAVLTRSAEYVHSSFRPTPHLASDDRASAFTELDAAIAKIIEQGGSPVELCEYQPGTGIVCCEDERVAGKFSVAGFSYVACILQSALEEASVKNRDQISDRNTRLVEEAKVATK